MRIKLLFTKEEYEKLKQCKENGYRTVCSAISCGEIGCDPCPLNGLRIEEQLEYIKNRLEEESNLKPVQHGHWILCKNYFPDGTEAFVCSLCGHAEAVEEPYCNCGAKMDGEVEE